MTDFSTSTHCGVALFEMTKTLKMAETTHQISLKNFMKILITGGAGFIGVNAARHFIKQGWGVTIFDNFSRRGTEVNLDHLKKDCPEVKVVRGDIRSDRALLLQGAEEHDVVLHLAAQVAVTTSVTDPRADFDINALGTFNVLEAVRMSNRQPMVLYASTNKVYGGLEHMPVVEGEKRYSFAGGIPGVTENSPLDFHSPYGCSKGAADQYVRDYARIYGLKTVVFRQSCIYGPHQWGIEDQGWVAWFMIAGLLGRPLTVYGNGKQVRDVLFVDDLISAYARAIEKIDSTSGQIYNIGGGTENTLSLLEFMALLKDQEQISLSYTSADWRPGDQSMFVSDSTKALNELGWQATVGPKEGVRKLGIWLREHEADLRQFYR